MTRKTELAGQIAVITGAGSGIGSATARLLAARGAKVRLADLNADAAEAVARQIRQAGRSAEAHGVNVVDPAAAEALAKAVYGGVAYGIQALVPRMLTQGRPASIVNTASLAGLVPSALMAPYCASKYGVVGMTEVLNAELSGQGIHVSAVWPGVINTAIARTGIRRGRMEAHRHQARPDGDNPGSGHRDLREARDATRSGRRGRPARDHDPQDDHHRPRKEALPGVLLHRISPRLAQPIARYFVKYASRGWASTRGAETRTAALDQRRQPPPQTLPGPPRGLGDLPRARPHRRAIRHRRHAQRADVRQAAQDRCVRTVPASAPALCLGPPARRATPQGAQMDQAGNA